MLKHLLSLGLLAAMLACNNEEQDLITEGKGNVGLSFKMETPVLRNDDLLIESAKMGLTEINIEQEDDDREEELELEMEGEYVLNLLEGTATPELPAFYLPAGQYEEMEIEFDEILQGAQTIEVKGTYSDSEGAPAPFVFY